MIVLYDSLDVSTSCCKAPSLSPGRLLYSVIVPVYNVQDYLRESVASVVAQTYDNWEIVLVDDGSTDFSSTICDELADELGGRVRVIHQNNAGLLAARRAGLRASRGDVVVILDSDDALRSDALAIIDGAFLRYGVDMVVYGFSRKPDFSAMGDRLFDASKFPSKAELAQSLCTSSALNSMWRKAVRRECLDVDADYSVYGRLNFAEDMLQTLPVIDRVKTSCCLQEALYFYRQNPSSLTHVFDSSYIDSVEICFSELRRYASKWAVELGRYELIALAEAHALNEYAMTAQNAAESLSKEGAVEAMVRIAALRGFSETYAAVGARDALRFDRRLIVDWLKRGSYSKILFLAEAKRLLRHALRRQ